MSKKDAAKDAARDGPSSLEKLASLTQRIVAVPKEEIDEQERKWKQRKKTKRKRDRVQ